MFTRNFNFCVKCPKKTFKAVCTKFTARTVKAEENNRGPDLISLAMEQNSTNWDKIRLLILDNESNKGRYTPNNIDSMIISFCTTTGRYELGESYFNYLLKENIKPNLATLGRYLRLLYEKNENNLQKIDESKILRLYEQIRNEYPVLDSYTLSNLVVALSLTKEWKKCLDMVEEIKFTTRPGSSTLSPIVGAAFKHKEEDLGFKMLTDMAQDDMKPKSIAYVSYINSVRKLRKSENVCKKMEKLFEFFKDSEIICQEDVVQEILAVSKSTGVATTVTLKGECKNCGKSVKKFDLSEEEFEELKQQLLKNVILGKDVFLKTNPNELAKFKDFTSNMGKFDVVLDGLNIAYSTGARTADVHSKLVRSVITHFVQQNKSVLMLGRVHMTRWPRDNWNYIKYNSTVFLTQNISQDDPYLLYCALNSGKDTIIVSRDLMRGHKFLLKSPQYKNLFQRWLNQRQYILLTVAPSGKPFFKVPADFSPIAQKQDNIWHIPYESTVEGSNRHYHKTWLCLNFR